MTEKIIEVIIECWKIMTKNDETHTGIRIDAKTEQKSIFTDQGEVTKTETIELPKSGLFTASIMKKTIGTLTRLPNSPDNIRWASDMGIFDINLTTKDYEQKNK